MASLRYCNGTESRKQLIRLAGSENRKSRTGTELASRLGTATFLTRRGVGPGRSHRFEVSKRDRSASCSDPSRWVGTGGGRQVGSVRSTNPHQIAKAFPP